MTAHMCAAHEAAFAGAPVPYDDLDPEMVAVVRALNTVPGLRTIDSCFGHSGSGDTTKNHQDFAFVGMIAIPGQEALFRHFWEDFFSEIDRKSDASTGWIQYDFVTSPFYPHQMYRFQVYGEHDPAIDPRGQQEKKEALAFLTAFVRDYLASHPHLLDGHDHHDA